MAMSIAKITVNVFFLVIFNLGRKEKDKKIVKQCKIH